MKVKVTIDVNDPEGLREILDLLRDIAAEPPVLDELDDEDGDGDEDF